MSDDYRKTLTPALLALDDRLRAVAAKHKDQTNRIAEGMIHNVPSLREQPFHEQLHDYKVQVEQEAAYNAAFYAAYEEYLKEPQVREAHNWIFSILTSPLWRQVVDFGCGRSMEYKRWMSPWRYLGIDENALTSEWTIRLNYRTCDLPTVLKNWMKCEVNLHTWPRAFVSLFSSEITDCWRNNYAFYNRVFVQCPTLRFGLVSGFYYEKRKDQPVVGETGGIQSHQTLEAIEDAQCGLSFTEKRIILPVPSKMFGDDVYEVWKIFERKAT